MAKVRILPQILAHQIAAGEIVERPASVVKELVENSLDADSSRIHVLVEEGGKQRIRVTDDGFGMSAEDARLAFEHHATSKIEKFEDLSRIRTLGFRGEALPSIASVSLTTLKTVDRNVLREQGPLGCEIEYRGGRLVSEKEISWPEGTEITIENLFYNVPARRKFLKTPATELSHISRTMTGYALANPHVEFQLDHGRKNIIDAPSVSSPRDRVFQLFGESLVENLVALDLTWEGIRISGFTSLPHEQRNNAGSLYLFVNGRLVRDRVLTHSIRQSYRDLIPAVAYPVTILFVELDPGRIDVNVHPTKVEIRFQESQKVHSAIGRAIERALLLNSTNLGMVARETTLSSFPAAEAGDFSLSPPFPGRSPLPFRTPSHPQSGYDPSSGDSRDPSAVSPPDPSLAAAELPTPDTGDFHSRDSIPETAHLSPIPVILGQFVESFIVAASRDAVMIIDQHVAHERILYDRALKAMRGGRSVEVQRLLLPCTVELTPQQLSIAGRVIDILNANGFDVDWFGPSSVIIRGIPSLAGKIDPTGVLEDLVGDITLLDETAVDPDKTLRRLQERIAVSLSCRAAVKINTPLTREKMQWMLDELFRCANPYTCPHGRPIILKMDIEQVLSGFHRI